MKYVICLLLLLTLSACTTPDPEATIDAWAKAAIAGDYVTARQYMRDPDLLFLIWQDQTERARREINPTSYTIIAHEQRGKTGVYWIRLNGTSPKCTIVELDRQGRISAPKPWAPNGICNAPGVTTNATR